jgi:osmotically-inducible protein OsmY
MDSSSGSMSFSYPGESDAPMSPSAVLTGHFESSDDGHNWRARGDERIKLAVMTSLHWDLVVPRNRVTVSVSGGLVTLIGRVDRDYEKSRAEADALMVSGVTGVVNQLTVQSG